MRVFVDEMACEANERCVEAAPEVFFMDENEELQILFAEVPTELEEVVRRAVEACPRAALRLEE